MEQRGGAWPKPEVTTLTLHTEDVFFLKIKIKIKTLEETLRLHRLDNSCQEFESWMDDKENILNTFSSDAGDLDVVQAKYEVRGTGGTGRPLQRCSRTSPRRPINRALNSSRTS